MNIEISPIELMALKKLAVICGALGNTISGQAAVEQRALTRVLVDVINRADVANVYSPAGDCPTCNGTGKEGRHSICRDCDEPASRSSIKQEG